MYKILHNLANCYVSAIRMLLSIVLFGFVGLSAPLQAEPIVADYSLSVGSTYIFNDRIGSTRFFTNSNSDSVRVGVYVTPSPDSDAIVAVRNGMDYLSGNGSDTTVRLDADRNVGLVRAAGNDLSFVGLTSNRGGNRNEYTAIFNKTTFPNGILEAWDTTPLTVTVRNPRAGSGPDLITAQIPDYDRNALPSFVNDLKLLGGGTSPKITWSIPPGGTPPTSVNVQIRRIDEESPDRTRITKATLVDTRTVPVSALSYDFSLPFSNANIPGFPSSLEVGKRYEISINLDVSNNGTLAGRARSFFEFTPLADGQGNVAVVLPSVGPDGIFKFDVRVEAGETVALDPVVAIGYDYLIGAGNPLFASVLLPEIGDGMFDLYLFDGSEFFLKGSLAAGEQYFFEGAGVDRFRIVGIEPSAGIDPGDATAFITKVTFAGSGRFTGTMQAITQEVAEVPEPGAIWLLGLGLIGLAAMPMARKS